MTAPASAQRNARSSSTTHEHGFDVAAFEARVQYELAERGVTLDRNEDIYLARLFATRVREMCGEAVELENMFAHPLWVHVATTHDEKRQSRVDDCKSCALLWTLWIRYAADRDVLSRQRAEIARASRRALPALATIRKLLAAEPSAIHDVELLAHFEGRLGAYAIAGTFSKALDAPVVRTRGRPAMTRLREIEHVLKLAGFSDSEISGLIFGAATPNALRSVKDRRRGKTGKKRREK